jgi:hypothetical protein
MAENLTILMCRFLKSGSINLLEPSGPLQACNGIALTFTMADRKIFSVFRVHHHVQTCGTTCGEHCVGTT